MTQHLVTQPAKTAECSRCGNTVITAITGGLTTVTDIQALSIGEEIAAILAGRVTFDLHAQGKQVFLEWRDIIRIRAGRNYPVVALHQCGPSARPMPIPAAPVSPLPDDPPF